MQKYLDIYNLALPQGPIKGAVRVSLYGKQYFSFEGIPYAKPPLGELRFKAPEPAEPWSDILDCTMFQSKPLQWNNFTSQIEGSEDCLYINVYAKKLQSDEPLPVMVFIYGGAFNSGGATREILGPDYLINEEVVVVTFNYRVSSLGFLSVSDPELGVPGNAALKDQVLALKWVNKYISHFNGDPKNITLFGVSAGGASTHYMCLTEQTRGLFQRAIVMSGSAVSFWAHREYTDLAYRLAKINGYDGENNDKDVLSFLRSLEPEKLVGHSILNEEERRKGYTLDFCPVIEPYIGEDCVVPKNPLEMLKKAWTNSIPMMIGGTSDEGIYMHHILMKFPQIMTQLQNDIERLLPVDILKSYTSEELKFLAEKLKQLHFGDKELNENAILEFLDFFKHKLFWHGILRTVLARLEYATEVPTYLYRFAAYSPDFNAIKLLFNSTPSVDGAAHGDDLCYLFSCEKALKFPKVSEEYKTIQRMVALWISFAINSNPNCDIIKPTEWQALTKSDPYQALNIGKTVEFLELPEKDIIKSWNSLYPKNELY